MATERTADGDVERLAHGGGRARIEQVGSGAFGPLEVTWAARATRSRGDGRAPRS